MQNAKLGSKLEEKVGRSCGAMMRQGRDVHADACDAFPKKLVYFLQVLL